MTSYCPWFLWSRGARPFNTRGRVWLRETMIFRRVWTAKLIREHGHRFYSSLKVQSIEGICVLEVLFYYTHLHLGFSVLCTKANRVGHRWVELVTYCTLPYWYSLVPSPQSLSQIRALGVARHLMRPYKWRDVWSDKWLHTNEVDLFVSGHLRGQYRNTGLAASIVSAHHDVISSEATLAESFAYYFRYGAAAKWVYAWQFIL